MWRSPRIGVLQVFTTPLLDESACNGAHHAQEEADKQDDIDANEGSRGFKGLITKVRRREEGLV
jgi:hypothetical protein